MAGLNSVVIIGNLTRDVELRHTPNGKAVTDISVAVNTASGKGEGRKEETVFIDVTVWERQAETCAEYLSKGSSVAVEGRLVQRSWEDKDSGQKRTKIELVANRVTFLDTKASQNSEEEAGDDVKVAPVPSEEDSSDEDHDNVPF